MSAVAEMIRMGKKTGRPKGERDDVVVRLPRPLASKAKAIAKERGITVAEVLEEILQAPLSRAYATMLRKLDGE